MENIIGLIEIDEQGAVTIPEDVLKKLNLNPGDEFEFFIEEDSAFAIKRVVGCVSEN